MYFPILGYFWGVAMELPEVLACPGQVPKSCRQVIQVLFFDAEISGWIKWSEMVSR